MAHIKIQTNVYGLFFIILFYLFFVGLHMQSIKVTLLWRQLHNTLLFTINMSCVLREMNTL